jgi:preprotein translocase subunit SecA
VWKEHLLALDHLRQGIGLRAYGQRDPLNEYKSEAFALFNAMLDELKERVTLMLARVELSPEAPPAADFQPRQQVMYESHPEPESALAELGVGDSMLAAGPAPVRQEAVDPNDPSTWRNSPRNAPCPCGSGKKFKHCHGKLV